MKAIIVCEGEYEETRQFRDQQHLLDFAEGFACGAGNYGCGSAGVYTLDDLEDETLEKKVRALILEHLSE